MPRPRRAPEALRATQTSALQREPRDTFALRLVLLRLALCTADPDLASIAKDLDTAGIPLLTFDTALTVLHHRQGALGMGRDEWLELFALLEHTEAADIIDALQQRHSNATTPSPLARIRATLEQSLGILPHASLLCQVFLVLYNAELDRATLPRRTESGRSAQHRRRTLELYRRMQAGAESVARSSSIPTLPGLPGGASSFCTAPQPAHRVSTTVRAARHTRDRRSLLRRVRNDRHTGRAQDITSAHFVEPSAWRGLSSGQQLVLLFLGMVHEHLDAAKLAQLVRVACASTWSWTGTSRTLPSTRAWWLRAMFWARIGTAVDSGHAHIAALLAKFRVQVCVDIFGESVVAALTLALCCGCVAVLCEPRFSWQTVSRYVSTHNARTALGWRRCRACLRRSALARRQAAGVAGGRALDAVVCEVLCPRITA